MPFDVWLASEYAAIWWGTGCKIIGPGAAELSIGITTAMGLLWTKYIGETEIVERTLEIFRGHLRGSLIRDWWESAQGKPRSALMFGTTLSIYDRLQHEGEALEAIQALTRANWGKYVWSTDVAARLAEVGVNLPKPFRRL